MRWLGPVLVVGGVAVGAAWYLRPDSWDEPITNLRTRFTDPGDSTSTQGGAPSAGPSAAQVLQDLRRDEASIDESLKRARDELQQLRSQTVSQSDVPEDVVHEGCTFWNNPGCMLTNVGEWVDAERRKLEQRRDAARARVRELERDLEVVRAEIDSVVMTR